MVPSSSLLALHYQYQFQCTQVLYSYVFGVLLLGDQITLLGVAGSVLIVVGVIMVNFKPSPAVQSARERPTYEGCLEGAHACHSSVLPAASSVSGAGTGTAAAGMACSCGNVAPVLYSHHVSSGSGPMWKEEGELRMPRRELPPKPQPLQPILTSPNSAAAEAEHQPLIAAGTCSEAPSMGSLPTPTTTVLGWQFSSRRNLWGHDKDDALAARESAATPYVVVISRERVDRPADHCTADGMDGQN
jgi:hypothetical protein